MHSRAVVFLGCLTAGLASAHAAPPVVKWSSDAVRWAPALLQVVDRGHRGVRKVRVRVHAEADYIANVPRWQERARAMFEDLNILAGPTFGVRFQVESLHRWEGVPRGLPAHKALALLETKDPGEDVDWVVGFIAALPLVTTSVHEIGMARDLGRHFVLRAMADLEEARAIKTLDLSSDEEQKLYTARKWHKEIAVFLHEWGHTLGAIHSSDEVNVMNPTYSHTVRVFSNEQMKAMDIALACRLGQPPVPAWSCPPLLAYLEKTNTSDWYTQDRAQALQTLREGMKGNQPNQAAESGGPSLPPAQAQAWNAALARLDEAQDGLKAGDLARAMAAMARAEEQARTLPEIGAPVWLSIARQYHALGALTRAEQALTRAATEKETPAARAELLRSRRVVGLPCPSIPADAEPEYVRTFDALAPALTASSAGAVASARRTYPDAPGLLMLECEVHLRAGRQRQAEKSCRSAIDAAPELSRAHYLLGLLESERGRAAEATTHLRKSIELDPGVAHHWESLGAIYRMKGKSKELSELSADYQKRFNKKLR